MSAARRIHEPARSAEFYRQVERADRQDSVLQTERCALLEVLSRLRVDQRALEAGAVALEGQCASLESKMERETKHSSLIRDEIDELEFQASVIRTQAAAEARRLDTIMQEVASLEEALHEHRSDVSIARKSLGGAVERVVRLDYKLRFCAQPDARSARRFPM